VSYQSHEFNELRQSAATPEHENAGRMAPSLQMGLKTIGQGSFVKN
jgi:hypothetical protein